MFCDLQSQWFLWVFFFLYIEIEDRQIIQNILEIVKYLDNLYKIILKIMIWFDVLRECQKDNMRLVSIIDFYQQAFLIVQAVRYNFFLWIGFFS